jgi:hypothetical protein
MKAKFLVSFLVVSVFVSFCFSVAPAAVFGAGDSGVVEPGERPDIDTVKGRDDDQITIRDIRTHSSEPMPEEKIREGTITSSSETALDIRSTVGLETFS